jgi:hypothetical protein
MAFRGNPLTDFLDISLVDPSHDDQSTKTAPRKDEHGGFFPRRVSDARKRPLFEKSGAKIFVTLGYGRCHRPRP